jgi:hypothetical protein
MMSEELNAAIRVLLFPGPPMSGEGGNSEGNADQDA